MRIGFSLVNLSIGGAQTFLVQLAEGLKQRGHTIFYYLSAHRDDPSQASPSLIAAMEDAAQRVIHPFSLLSCQAIQLDGFHSLLRKLPYLFHFGRCVETFHSSYSIRRSGPLYAPHRVAVSNAVEKELNFSSKVIYCGVPIPQSKYPIEKRYDIAILGRIHPVKNHLLFLRVCEMLHAQRGKLDGLIIGGHPVDSPYQERVDFEVSRLNAKGISIIMTGDLSHQEVYDWLLQCKVLMVTSTYEGFGRMALEAMACQVPVIANPVGGLVEIIQHERNGFLAELNDPESFLALANLLLDDTERCQQMGQSGREDVSKRFSLERMLDAYEVLYSQIAGV